jgi:hypothetical protein
LHNLIQLALRLNTREANFYGNSTQEKLVAEEVEFIVAQKDFQSPQVWSQGTEER